jgi:hypothetical protein
VCRRLTSLLSYCIECKICRCYAIIFFVSFSDSGTYAQFSVYFTSFLIPRYRTDVIYSWKGLLGELSNTYERPNYNHIVCAHSVRYTALWLCYIMCTKSTEIDLKNIVSHNIITEIVSLASFLLKTTSRTNNLIKLPNRNYWSSSMNYELLLSLLNNKSH